jgi:hypothetical protein
VTVRTGKPRGRPRGAVNLSTREMRAKAQGHADRVLEVLMQIVEDEDQPGEVRIKAGKEILDRGYGKAPQSVKATDSSNRYDWSKVPIEKVRMVAETLRLAQRDGIVIDNE